MRAESWEAIVGRIECTENDRREKNIEENRVEKEAINLAKNAQLGESGAHNLLRLWLKVHASRRVFHCLLNLHPQEKPSHCSDLYTIELIHCFLQHSHSM